MALERFATARVLIPGGWRVDGELLERDGRIERLGARRASDPLPEPEVTDFGQRGQRFVLGVLTTSHQPLAISPGRRRCQPALAWRAIPAAECSLHVPAGRRGRGWPAYPRPARP